MVVEGGFFVEWALILFAASHNNAALFELVPIVPVLRSYCHPVGKVIDWKSADRSAMMTAELFSERLSSPTRTAPLRDLGEC